MKIAFYVGTIGVRGTSVALYDYARYNEDILGNKSIVLIERDKLPQNDMVALVKFLNRFDLIPIEKDELQSVLEREGCDVLYAMKYGKKDDIVYHKGKTVVHCVFDMSESHGDVYAGVSKELAEKYGSSVYVPHMIGIKPINNENLRESLGIPSDAVVFGRYGGPDTFNIDYCWDVIDYLVHNRKDMYFIFINTDQVVKHPQIKYLEKIASDEDKNRYLNTLDAFLECGTLGHSFGLAIGEASTYNKPIICYKSNNLWNTAHLAILGDKALYFTNLQEFFCLLYFFDKKEYEGKDMNCYRDFSPEKVMEKFKAVFLD
jgi:hypothetical protein